MSLSTYKKKRDFAGTPEPEGRQRQSSKKLIFVVQKHKASHLHYDFRLELDGVLKSWAVPKGPSLNPADKRLAMMVEDHPYDYKDFEGEIPKGHYGAGQVIVWDNGTYELWRQEDDWPESLEEGLKKGDLKFILHGQKLNGAYALIKTPRMGQNAWLLIKHKDRYAAAKDVTKWTGSVISGRKIGESTKTKAIDVSAQPKKPLPQKVKPMLATLTDKAFSNDDWLFEIKWDGYRALLAKDGRGTRLYSRNAQNFGGKYPEVLEEAKKIDEDFLLDGEIVALDKDGKARFEWLQNWQKRKNGVLAYFAFDIIWYNSRDLADMPLINRKEVLNGLLKERDVLRYSDYISGSGEKFFEAAKEQGLEGIMAKRAASRYQTGRRSRDWLKIKTHQRQEAVIGGFTEPRGSRKHIGALILGVYKEGELIYVGHTGGGIPTELLPDLRQTLEGMARKTSPFANSFKPNAPVHWVEPKLVCEVSFGEWTSSGHMRQPIFEGLREDKPPKDVRKEDAVPTEDKAGESGHRLELTHLDKVFWPKPKHTKGDLVDYYKSVGEIILPYVKDRPHSLLRQPDGINGEAFFQKDIDHMPPDWIKTEAVYSESNQKNINYLVADSVDSILYMVQLGCIEINPWNSTIRHLDKPDWTVIDLDPEDIGFDKVIETALAVREVCDKFGIESYPKTSGKTGIHIYIPLAAKYSYEQAKQFAQLLADFVNEKTAGFTSLARLPKKRQKKVYLDFLQNRKGQTLAAPYSVRPTPAATVSTPLQWEEVNKRLKPENFTIENTAGRLDKVGDLWEPLLGKGIDMKKILSGMKA